MKVGLITYHSAYNFGSVLQAYATQETIKKIIGNCEIINYRTDEQRRVYSIFKWGNGFRLIKSAIKNFLIIFKYSQRKDREKKYENVFNKLFNLSDTFKEPIDVYNVWDKYDIIVSGSDQIWNKHSNELENVSWEYMKPYLLSSYTGKKVSYASSLTNMSSEEIDVIIDDIRSFDFVSFRENETCDMMNDNYNLDCYSVLDPTFLLTKEEWIEKLNLKKNDNDYCLFYSLGSFKDIKRERHSDCCVAVPNTAAY